MHTSILRPDMFQARERNFAVPAGRLLDWGPADRLGVIVTAPLEAMGASLLIQLAIALWYSEPTRRRCHPVLNPEVHMIHVGRMWGNMTAYDFFPERKEVLVRDDPWAILDEINNRAVTHLLVPDVPERNLSFDYREAESAAETIKQCFLYSADGSTSGADISLSTSDTALLQNSIWTLWSDPMLERLSTKAEGNRQSQDRTVGNFLRRKDEVSPEERTLQEMRFSTAQDKSFLTETYRRIGLNEALGRLYSPHFQAAAN